MTKTRKKNKLKIELLTLKDEFYKLGIYSMPKAKLIEYKPHTVSLESWLKDASNLWNLRGGKYEPFIEILKHILKSYE